MNILREVRELLNESDKVLKLVMELDICCCCIHRDAVLSR